MLKIRCEEFCNPYNNYLELELELESLDNRWRQTTSTLGTDYCLLAIYWVKDKIEGFFQWLTGIGRRRELISIWMCFDDQLAKGVTLDRVQYSLCYAFPHTFGTSFAERCRLHSSSGINDMIVSVQNRWYNRCRMCGRPCHWYFCYVFVLLLIPNRSVEGILRDRRMAFNNIWGFDVFYICGLMLGLI